MNRNEYDVSGRQMTVPHEDGMRYFDLVSRRGVEAEYGRATTQYWTFRWRRMDTAQFLAVSGEPDAQFRELMAKMAQMTAKPLSSYSHEWKSCRRRLWRLRRRDRQRPRPREWFASKAATSDFKVEGIEIEGTDDIGVDVQYPWEDSARRFHEHPMEIKPFYIDKYPVTNAEFKKFLDASHYHPKDDLNFLKDWKNGAIPKVRRTSR